MWLADDVSSSVRLKIGYALCRHVVDISHVVLEARDAPPESERVRESGRSLPIESGRHRAMSLLSVELLLGEVSRLIEFRDFILQRLDRLGEFIGRSLTADRDRPRVVQRVVVHPD